MFESSTANDGNVLVLGNAHNDAQSIDKDSGRMVEGHPSALIQGRLTLYCTYTRRE